MDKHCRICHNTSCSNHGKNISFLGDGWKCNYIPVPTNADRIRAMTDEELMKLHYSGSAHCIADDPTVCDRHDFVGNLTPCEQCYLKWLQQPAEEDDHA